MEELDLVVVGAGWFGLAAAKEYREINPEASLAVLDAASTLGGVWAKHRLYPGLKTNNMLGTYEYPDFPMDTETFGVKPGEHIPGHVCHDYLLKYADKFGISDKIRYESKVLSAEHRADGGWTLTVQGGFNSAPALGQTKILARKLIVATGLISEPFLPHISGQEVFGCPIFHSRDFLQHADTLDTTKRVTVFGGTKSAWDAVYAYARKGIRVDWVIRESGHGPAWMAPPYVTPAKRWLEKVVHTRIFTLFSPCIWGFADGYTGMRWFLHETALGRAITNGFWASLGSDATKPHNLDSHPQTAKLKPWTPAFFTASGISILNYETDFFELLRNGTVKVHIADLNRLTFKAVHLSNGMMLASEALCCVTGWKHVPPLKFLPEGIEKDLGIPHAPSPSDPKDLVERADAEILAKFPRLKDQPVFNKRFVPLLSQKGISTKDEINPSTELTPYALYRFMVPATPSLLKHRDIAFAGMVSSFTTPIVAHLQGLWINAYFRNEVSFPDWTSSDALEKLQYETTLFSRFGKWRYPTGHGSKFPDFVFDALPYLDLLSGDLGLKVHRKKGVYAETFEPYGPEDYKNTVAEWREKQESLKSLNSD